MTEIETIREIAQQALSEGAGIWLWDRTQRIVKNCENIVKFEGFLNADVPIDKFCLTAAAYFVDSGVAYKRKQNKAVAIDIEPEELAELSAMMVNEKLSAVLTSPRLASINNIISEVANRFTKLAEAMVLADARTLDDVGLTGIMSEFRKGTTDGKDIKELVSAWRRKYDYKYWDARLREGFRFNAVRKVAQQRFARVEKFIGQLENEIKAEDL